MLDEELVNHFVSLVEPADFGDIRLGASEGTAIEVDSGEVRSMSSFESIGFGVRIRREGIWGFASSTSLTKEAVEDAVKQAYKIARSAAGRHNEKSLVVKPVREKISPPWRIDPRSVEIDEKLDVAIEADRAARLPNVNTTQTIYQDSVVEWSVANTLGTLVHFYASYPRLMCIAFVKDESATQSVMESLDANCGFELFESGAPEKIGRRAGEKAVRLLGAKPVKAGSYDVVLDPAMTGVYTHEAFGHASEADLVLAGSSVLENKLGHKVGSEVVNIVDDPSIQGVRGSFPFDQEGTRAKRRSIVEAGVLKGYLHTLETAAHLGVEPNGAARAMDFACKPIARMSNTFIAPGEHKEELYRDVRLGVMFSGFQYGYVDPGSGKFMFKAQYGQMIRDGELAEYVRDAALTGSTLDVLSKIDAVGSSLSFQGGTCGKNGQWVPCSTGGPFVRVRGVVVGGQ
jgi:TldD protein